MITRYKSVAQRIDMSSQDPRTDGGKHGCWLVPKVCPYCVLDLAEPRKYLAAMISLFCYECQAALEPFCNDDETFACWGCSLLST